jgi:hypothetical protein
LLIPAGLFVMTFVIVPSAEPGLRNRIDG